MAGVNGPPTNNNSNQDFAYTRTIDQAIGTIERPPGTNVYVSKTTPNENQLLPFVSNLLAIGAIVAGVWVLINVIIAAYTAIMSEGDPKAMDKVKTSITNSVIGLLLIVLAYTFTAIVSALFFGDASFLIKPRF